MKYKTLSLLLVLSSVAACSGEVTPADPNPTPHDVKRGPGVFSKDGNLLSNLKGLSLGNGFTELGVNPYLWRSSLQSLSFMPLVQADSAGGVIISDWIDQEDVKNKQVKVNVYILSKKLEATGLQIKVFTRTKKANGEYSSPIEDKSTATALEETILSNARALKIKARAE